MMTQPASFKDFQSYPSILYHIHMSLLKQAKKSKTDFGATKKIALANGQQ